jgi:hypothetical protein
MQKWFFNYSIVILYGFLACYWRFLANIGGYWALFEARYWGEVGIWLPTSNIYKPSLIESMERRFKLGLC